MAEHEIRRALGKTKGEKLHTHAIRYERAHNGGFHAHVERHTADGGHHHTEHHVLTSPEDAQEHLDEHMGDQPAVGEQEPAETAPPPGAEEAMAGGGTAPAGPMA